MHYVYLYLTAALAFLWGVYYFVRPDLRAKLVFSSLISLPLGFTEPLLIPGYWVPRFRTIPLGEETFLGSLLFCGFLGGFSAVTWQVVARKGLFELPRVHPAITLVAPALFLVRYGLYYPQWVPFSVNVMVSIAGSMIVGSLVYVGALGRRAAGPVIFSGVAATAVYTAVYLLFWNGFEELRASYQYRQFLGFYLLGLPVEEYLWIFSFACYWAPLYEIWRGARSGPGAPARLTSLRRFFHLPPSA